MITICKNCSHKFKDNYCGNCGQAASTHKINLHYLWHDIQHGLFHFDKGILFTTKELFTRPGHSIRDFIEGKRVQHFRPISLVIVLASVYALLYHTFHLDVFTKLIEASSASKSAVNEITNWAAEHYAISTLITLPFMTIGTYLAFRKTGYNFVEFLVLNSFLVGQRLIVHLLILPVYKFSNDLVAYGWVSGLSSLIDITLVLWAYIQFFNKKPVLTVASLTLLSYILYYACLVLIGTLIGIVFGLEAWQIKG